MAEITVRISKKSLEKEADMIKALASDEVFQVIKNKPNFQIVKMGLIHLAKSGELLKQICIHFPRRLDKLNRAEKLL